MRLATLLIATLALTACGGGHNPDKAAAERIPEGQRVGAQKVEILAGSPAFAGGAISGAGTVRFAEPLPGRDTANNFSLSLELAEGEAVTLIANANRDLGAGIEVEISRPAGATNPRVVARAGADTLDLSGNFAPVDVKKPMSLAFDLHNDHGDSVHVVLFDDGNNGANLGEDQLRGKGAGALWGLRLAGGRVTGITRAGARDVH